MKKEEYEIRQKVKKIEDSAKIFFETFALEHLKEITKNYKSKYVMISILKPNVYRNTVGVGGKFRENKRMILFKEDFEIEYIFHYDFSYAQVKPSGLELLLNCYFKDKNYYGKTKFDLDKYLEIDVSRHLIRRLYDYMIKFTVKSLRDILKEKCIVKYDRSSRWVVAD